MIIIEQIHRHVNLLTILVEDIIGKDAAVKVDGKNKVVKWKSFIQIKNQPTLYMYQREVHISK